MAIKKRLAAHNPADGQTDGHVRVALRYAIATQKRTIQEAESFDTPESELQKEYNRLAYYERMLSQEGLLTIAVAVR